MSFFGCASNLAIQFPPKHVALRYSKSHLVLIKQITGFWPEINSLYRIVTAFSLVFWSSNGREGPRGISDLD